MAGRTAQDLLAGWLASLHPKPIVLLDGASALGPGPAVNVDGRSLLTLYATGTFVGRIVVEAQLEAGDPWVSTGVEFTAPGIKTLQGHFVAIRGNVVELTSGSVTVKGNAGRA